MEIVKPSLSPCSEPASCPSEWQQMGTCETAEGQSVWQLWARLSMDPVVGLS